MRSEDLTDAEAGPEVWEAEAAEAPNRFPQTRRSMNLEKVAVADTAFSTRELVRVPLVQ